VSERLESPPVEPAFAPGVADELAGFALEYEADGRRLRWALVAAAALHGALFFVPLPAAKAAAVAPVAPPRYYLVEQVRFRAPRASAQADIQLPPAKRAPIREPTPEAPEPIRVVQQVEQRIEVPIDDTLYGVPAAPPAASDLPEGPVEVGGDVKHPVKISGPQPVYTEIAKKRRVQGVVIVQAIIDRQGNVTNVKVLRGLPMGLDEASVEAMKQWKFKPATLNGRPITVYYNLTVNFKLQ